MTRLPLLLLVATFALAPESGEAGADLQSPPPQAVPAPQAESPVPADFVIGASDVLGVVFWREPELSGDLTVRPDGRITIPVIGEIQAAGLRPATLQENIRTAAGKYIADPNVAVVLRTINSRKVFVTGRVATPGAHSLTGPLTVLQAIALAGGLTEYADAKSIAVLRTENGRTVTFQFNYREVSRGRNLAQNIQLQPGDTIVVP